MASQHQPSSPRPSTGDDRLATVIRRWYDIEFATSQTPQQIAWVNTAILVADQAAADAAATSGERVVHRDGAWFRRAYHLYERLRARHELADLASSHTPSARWCAADPDLIRAWLAAPTDQPGISVAEQLGVDDGFHLQSVTLAGDLNTLVTAAGEAKVFGLPGHHVELWIVTDNDHLVDGHLLTVDFPDGTRLASHHLPADQLIDGDQDGTDAAVGVLVNAKQVVDELVDTHHTVTGRAGPAAHTAASLAASSFATGPAPAATPPGPAGGTAQPGPSPRNPGARHGR